MANLKDLLVNGPSNLIGDVTVNKIRLTSLEVNNGTNYDPGSNGQVLKSNGTSVYWANDNNTTSFTITANATDGLWDLTGTNGTNSVTYALTPYSSKQTVASFYTGTTAPSLSTRLNYDGYLYAKKLYSDGAETITKNGGTINNSLTLQKSSTSADSPELIFNGQAGNSDAYKWSIQKNSSGDLIFSKTSLNNTFTTTIVFGANGYLLPNTTDTYDLGSSSKKWRNIYGNLKGNADTATNDSDNNPINTTYIKKSIGTAAGDMIYWSDANTPVKLGISSSGSILHINNNNEPSWSSSPFHSALISKSTTVTTTLGETYGIAGVATGNSNTLYTKWFVNLDSGITTPINGMIIQIKIPVAGVNAGCAITLDGGTTFYPVAINANDRFTTQFGVNDTIILQFDSSRSIAAYGKQNGTTNGNATTNITGCWRLINTYDTTTNTLLRTYALSNDNEYPIAGLSTTTDGSAPASHTSSYKDLYGMIPSAAANKATINLSTGKITIPGGIQTSDITVTSLSSSSAVITDSNLKLVSRAIKNNTSLSSLGWSSTAEDIALVTSNTIKNWNGGFQNTNTYQSNLAYFKGGFFDNSNNFIPRTNNSQTLGNSSSNRWLTIYSKNLDLSNNLTLSNLASHKNHLICNSDANGTLGVTNYIYTTQQDGDGIIIPHINNDLAFLLSRNGTVDFHTISSSSVTDNTFIDSTISNYWNSFSIEESDKRKLFNGSLNYYQINSANASTYLIIDIKCPTEHPSEQQFRYYNYFYIDFQADQYNVKNIWLYTKNGESSNYSLVDKIQDNTNGYWNSTILNNSGFTHLRIVLNTWTTCRITQIGLVTHNSMGARGPFMSRGEDDLIYRNLTPGNPSGSALYDIGSSTNRWNDIYGNLKGNADTATGIDPNMIDSSITNNETINNGLIYLKNSNGEKQFQCSSLTKINAQGLKVETTTNSNLEYQLANNVAKINLRIDSSGNRGLYDPTSGGNWLLLINSNNAVRIKNFTSYYEFMPVAETGKILGKKGSSTQSWMILAQYSNVQTPGWYMVTVSVLAGSGGQTYWGGIVPWISASGAEEGYRILNNYNIDGNTSAYAGVELQFYRRHKTYGACFILQNPSTTDILTINHNTKVTLQYIAPYTDTFYS